MGLGGRQAAARRPQAAGKAGILVQMQGSAGGCSAGDLRALSVAEVPRAASYLSSIQACTGSMALKPPLLCSAAAAAAAAACALPAWQR